MIDDDADALWLPSSSFAAIAPAEEAQGPIFEIPPEDFFVHVMPCKCPPGEVPRHSRRHPSEADYWAPHDKKWKAQNFYWLSNDPASWLSLDEEQPSRGRS